MKYIIDRFEEGFAVLEDENGNMTQISRALIPDTAKEGDCLLPSKGGAFISDPKRTQDLKQETDRLIDDVFK